MKEFVTNLRHEIEQKIGRTEPGDKYLLTKIKANINGLQESLSRLRVFILNYQFRDQAEEIIFFKELKPELYGQLLFYIRLYRIVEKCPQTDPVSERICLAHELKLLDQTFTNSLDFFRYYRSGDTSQDARFFLRSEYDWALDHDPLLFEKDRNYSTSYDYEVAHIIANDLLKAYLLSRLEQLNRESGADLITLVSKNQMQWTDSKVALIELAYSIHSSRSINHGTIDLKDLISGFEILFNVRIGDFYRAFLEIRERKNRTQYLDQMRKALIERMDDFDNK